MSRIDVLTLDLRSYPTRDNEMTALVANYLRMQGLSVVEANLYIGLWLIIKYRPRVLYITNFTGNPEPAPIALWAKCLGSTIVASCGEGIAKKNTGVTDKIGWVERGKNPIDMWLAWNKEFVEVTGQRFPEVAERLRMAGCAGYDRYSIAKPKKLAIPNGYKMCIGVGCWTWNQYQRIQGEGKVFFEQERQRFTQELQKIIRNNPDVFFILKQHPQSISEYHAGIEGCAAPNVLITKIAPIIECLHAADIWLNVESSTAVEAWFLGKPTALLNPSGVDWPVERHDFYLGQPNFATADDWQVAIDAFHATGELPGFAALQSVRERLMVDIAGHIDGLNHVRMGNHIIDAVHNPSKRPAPVKAREYAKLVFNNCMHANFAKYHRFLPKKIPYFKQFETSFKALQLWNAAERETLSKIRYTEQEAFYKKQGKNLKMLRELY